jgi:parallel beta-helix repeat protein
MKRIFLFLSTLVATHSFATNYYVSPSGNDDNDGLTITTSFLTIERATYAVSAGDTVYIRNGIYTKTYPESLIAYLTISGTEGNPVTFRNYPGETPILQMNGTNWAAIAVNGCDYITIDGLTIIGNNDNITLQYAQEQQLNIGNPATSGNGIAINTEYNNETNKPHHTIVRNCTISKCGGGGIYTYNADYTTIENNIVSECGWYAPYGNSGISLYQNWNSDSFNGIKNFITGNTCYRNENYIPFFVAGVITDGNGIIIDDSRNTQNGSTLGIYNGLTYVANNLVFDNGGRGIHCYESDNVIIVNNTCYKNCQSPFTQQGEFTAFDASNITYYNNIASPDTGIAPIFAYSETTSNITSQYNLFTANEELANPISSTNVLGNADFILPSTNASIADFHLQSTSQAIAVGTSFNAPLLDKDGIIRLQNGTIDVGCYEFQTLLGNLAFTSDSLAVFPNPAQNTISIQLKDNANSDLQITIYNALGQNVKTINTFSEKGLISIDISSFEAGVYFISIGNKKEVIYGKFIKE